MKCSKHIKITVENEDPCWRFSVIDNGIGIDPAYSNSIFDLFSRLHTDNEFEGTGLAMCRNTTFHFTLPKAQSEESHCHT